MATAAKSEYPKEVTKNPSRQGMDFNVDPAALDPNRKLPIDPPQVERMWDRKAAVPPQYLGFAWRNYSARYLDGEQPSLFDRLFGSQEKIANYQSAHPCHEAAAKVNACLDRNNDKGDNRGDYCRSIVNVFEGCLREHNK
jgi:hypothetical protein